MTNNNGKEKIKITRLEKAQKVAENEQVEVAKGLRAAFYGEDLFFTGILGKVSYVSKAQHIKKFNLYYASIDDDIHVKLTFRKMLCRCDETLIDGYINNIQKLDENDGCDNIMNQVTIYGQFAYGGKPMFIVTSIENYNHDRENKAVYTGEFNYDIFYDMMNRLKDVDDDNPDNAYTEIESMGSSYSIYIGIFDEYKRNERYADLRREQMLCLKDMYMFINNTCNTINYDLYTDKYNGTKIQKIIEDIAMMHTSIQSEDYDQLGVLYDSNCLRAMYESTILVRSLLLLCDDEYIDNKQIIIVLLVYFKKFYADYLKFIKIPISALPAYRGYVGVVDQMLKDLSFDTSKEEELYSSMKKFVDYTRTM